MRYLASDIRWHLLGDYWYWKFDLEENGPEALRNIFSEMTNKERELAYLKAKAFKKLAKETIEFADMVIKEANVKVHS
ncbi:MAG TPA: hypothetical protein VK212_09635 [Lentimicrobium sp.]|nr:hypothetical protein [Lentimicrobium sp.]